MRGGRRVRPLLLATALAVVACGSSPAPSGGPSATPGASPSAMPCTAASPSAHPPIGATQALSVIPVRVLADVPVSAAILKLGQVSCVTVGVGQTVSIEVAARVPPRPAEARAGSPLLSRITLSPAVPSAAAAPRSGRYRLTFTAQAAGATMITYLAATCTLPPGVC